MTGAVEEATEKVAADKEDADKSIMDEATVKGVTVGAVGDSPPPPPPRPSALFSGREQEGGGSKRLHPAGQMTLQGRLETLVCLVPPFLTRLHSE
jgi:hypothetical protein